MPLFSHAAKSGLVVVVVVVGMLHFFRHVSDKDDASLVLGRWF